MLIFENKIAIFGAGGFGKEVICYLMDCLLDSKYKIEEVAVLVVDDKYFREKVIYGIPVIPHSEFSYRNFEVLVAVGDPLGRKDIVERLPIDTRFLTLIHPKAIVSRFTEIGLGSIIAPGVVVSCDTKIGKHAGIHYNSTIGHDCIIGDYITISPGANISGKCNFDDCVYIGANASIREKTRVCKNVTIGLGASVVKDISEEGIYIGNPAKKLEKK